MRIIVEAYDDWDRQILGNLDGQGIIEAKNFRLTNHYKFLRSLKTLNNRVAYYNLVNEQGETVERVVNNTHWSNL